MSTVLLSLMRENPLPGLAAASLNLMVALFLVGLSVSLGITISLIAWAHTLASREHDAGPADRSPRHHLLGQRLDRTRRMRVRHDRTGARAQRSRA
jgi:hypothetical protein